MNSLAVDGASDPVATERQTGDTARDATGVRPHCSFEWSAANPVAHLLRYLLLVLGDTSGRAGGPCRRNDPEPTRRPAVHVGG